MEDELREKIARWLYERDYRNSHIWMDWNDAGESYMKLADGPLSLIDSQRCVWTLTEEGLWKTQCGEEIPDEDTYEKYPFCPCCGKRIEVEDA